MPGARVVVVVGARVVVVVGATVVGVVGGGGAVLGGAVVDGGVVEPVVVGLAMGLLAYAYPAARSDLERATERFREFREQPTPATTPEMAPSSHPTPVG